MPVQVLPTICRFDAALPRTAENAALRMRLPRTMTLSARKMLMALPHSPEPPDLFANIFDAVVDDERAVVAGRRAPNQNAAVAGAVYGVGIDAKSTRVDRKNGDIAGGDRIACYFASDRLKRNAIAAGADNFAIGDAHEAASAEVQKSAPFREWNSGAVEHKTGYGDVVAAGGRQHRGPSRHDDAGCACNTGDRCVGRQHKRPGAIEAGRQPQHRTRSRCLLDGTLKNLRLVFRRVWPQTEHRAVDLGAMLVSRWCGLRVSRTAHCAGAGNGREQVAAIDAHQKNLRRKRDAPHDARFLRPFRSGPGDYSTVTVNGGLQP